MRKLRRKGNLEEILSKPMTVKKRIVYKKQRCAAITEDGTQCERNAVGRGNACAIHAVTPELPVPLESVSELSVIPFGSKYNPAEHPLQYINLSRQGLSDVEIASEFEVSMDTLKAWTAKYKDFNMAFEIGRAMFESWWINEGRGNLGNRFYQTSLYKFLTGNKLGWSDKIESKNLNQNSYGVLLVPPTMTMDEWERNNVEETIDI